MLSMCQYSPSIVDYFEVVKWLVNRKYSLQLTRVLVEPLDTGVVHPASG